MRKIYEGKNILNNPMEIYEVGSSVRVMPEGYTAVFSELILVEGGSFKSAFETIVYEDGRVEPSIVDFINGFRSSVVSFIVSYARVIKEVAQKLADEYLTKEQK